MKRIILHWTGGKYTPSSTDFEHYHFLVDKCGDILKGKYTPEDNLNCNDGKYAAYLEHQASVENKDGNFHVTFTGEGAVAAAEETKDSKPANWALFVGKDFIGDGSEELGNSLMTMFFYTLAESNDPPRYILFMNSGVKLPVENDQVVEHLKTLQDKGSEILVCGTCLKFFNIADSLKIGTVSNMYDISERMHAADKVITL